MQHGPTLPLSLVAPSQISARSTIAVGVATVAILVLPGLTLAMSAIAVVIQVTLLFICNLPSTRRAPASQPHGGASVRATDPKLSIHIAARNEPPGVLIATLESLRRQIGAPGHEVIVVINNTPSPHLWQPIEKWCRAAGPRFRFVRRDNLSGAKAGALNIALDRTDASASHIVVLDADYQVVPDFLSMVGEELRGSCADFLQFPQAYRHVSRRTEGLSLELAEYFNRHARAANMADAMLLTGTLSAIRRDALVAVGGWPNRSCTEDAELGATLIAAGYRGVFVDRVVGRGLMPLDLRNLHRQRQRWAAGNARVLAGVLRSWLGTGQDKGAGQLQRLLVIAQLSAWLNLGAIAVVTLVAGMAQAAIGRWSGHASAVPEATILLSATIMALILFATVFQMLHGMRAQVPAAVRMQALASRLSMVPIAACATLEAVLRKRQEFRVTAKIRPVGGAARVDATLLVTAALGTVLILAAALLGEPMVAMAGMLMLLPPLGGLAILTPLSRYAADVAGREL